jgi:hypothetical protein
MRHYAKLLRATLTALLMLATIAGSGSTFAWCQTDVLQFAAYARDALYKKLMNDQSWRIFATGVIDPDAATRLAALIENKRIPRGSMLYLHSPGGRLAGGIALGRVIREHGLNTSIGQFDPNLKYVGSKPGYCYSACAMAFLSGEFRYWNQGSVYGVHRFFSKVHSDTDADTAQIVSAALVEYIRSMGVDSRLFGLASQAGPTNVITPSHETLLELNIENDGRKSPKWTIESLPIGVMYLKGEQETDNGLNKFIIACPADAPMFLQAFFAGGPTAQQTLAFPVSWLFIDGEQVRIDRQLKSKSINDSNGTIILTYSLNAPLLTAISKAKTVGVGLQPSTAAAIFAGFNYLPFADGATKLPGFLAFCNRSRK